MSLSEGRARARRIERGGEGRIGEYVASCVGPVSLPRPGSGFRSGGRISMAHFTAFSLHRPPRTRTSARTAYYCSGSPAASAWPWRRRSAGRGACRGAGLGLAPRRVRPESAASGAVARSRAGPGASAQGHGPGPRRHAPPSRPRAPQPRTGRVFRGVFYTIHRPHRAPREGAGLANMATSAPRSARIARSTRSLRLPYFRSLTDRSRPPVRIEY